MEVQIVDRRNVKANQIETFVNANLNVNVRTIRFEDGSIGINAEDAARGFGWTRIRNEKEYILWDRVNEFLSQIGFPHKCGKEDYIPESLFYMLGMKANNKTAQDFQKWLAIDVIPSIRQTGGYIQTNEEDDEETIMAKALLVAQKTIEKKNKKIQSLEQETLRLVDTIEKQKPRLEYLDEILSCDNAMLVTNIAFDYGLSARALNKILCEERIQRKVRNQYILYADYLGKGYTKTETEMYGGKPRTQTLWTQKGRMLIHEVLSKRQIRPLMDLELAEA